MVRRVIGIHSGHNSSVAFIENGALKSAIQEERLTRMKNQGDLPLGGLCELNDIYLKRNDPKMGEIQALKGLVHRFGYFWGFAEFAFNPIPSAVMDEKEINLGTTMG